MNHCAPIVFALAVLLFCAVFMSSALAQKVADTSPKQQRKLVPRPIPGVPTPVAPSIERPIQVRVPTSAAQHSLDGQAKAADTTASAGPARVLAIRRSGREFSPNSFSRRRAPTPTGDAPAPARRIPRNQAHLQAQSIPAVTGPARIMSIRRGQSSRLSAAQRNLGSPGAELGRGSAEESAEAPLQEGKIRIIYRRAARNRPDMLLQPNK